MPQSKLIFFEECGGSSIWKFMQNELQVSCDNLMSWFMVYLSKINMPGGCVFFLNCRETRFLYPPVTHLIIRFSSFL